MVSRTHTYLKVRLKPHFAPRSGFSSPVNSSVGSADSSLVASSGHSLVRSTHLFCSYTVALLFLSSLLLNACSSSETREIKEREEGNGRTHPAAYTVEGFDNNFPYKKREVKPQSFFPKSCEMVGEKIFYSKTSYECTDNQ